MNDKILMGKISYINAFPVYYGLDNGLLPDWLEMVSDVPSGLNRRIKTGQIQISPVSSAFYALNHEELLLLPDLSISCHGRVLSVILASNFKIDDLRGKKVMLSRESASAAFFLKMILGEKNIEPVFESGPVDDIHAVSQSADAVLVIGDTALTLPWHRNFEFCIDLGDLWYRMTRLPFVFAVWAVRKSFAGRNPSIVKNVHDILLESKKEGYRNTDKIIEAGGKKLNLNRLTIKKYFDFLYCDLDEIKIRSMEKYFDSLYDQKILKTKVDIKFFAYDFINKIHML